MSKKTTKHSEAAATIEEQTAAFLKSGGAIQYVLKGTSGQTLPIGSKPLGSKNS